MPKVGDTIPRAVPGVKPVLATTKDLHKLARVKSTRKKGDTR